MKQNKLFIIGILGSVAVALGALGAHFLKAKMQAGLITADQLSGFDTASKYQLFHAIVLLALFFYNKEHNFKWINASAKLIILGTLLFSGSLFILTTRNLTGLNSVGFLGPITPLGGLALIAGWVCLIVQSLKYKK